MLVVTSLYQLIDGYKQLPAPWNSNCILKRLILVMIYLCKIHRKLLKVTNTTVKYISIYPYKFHHFKQWPRATSAQSIAVDSGLRLKAMSMIQFYMVPNLLATESLFSISLEHHSELHIFPDHVDSERFLLLYCGIEDDCVLKFSQFNIQDELDGGILSINILLVQKQQHFAND